ncbi:18.5 kDa class I heat shock protein-like [Populus alba x Populus x berolinensis]|uniref:18.5 kDa class I heat shock protein-like n=1 Tax=Populus alba x Populus x berolinensis TaxID=444605 RepID=A0AAD6LD99_9ROSI|nr:18.5 kDa class I heat shock protein-like [Populus alba x Populus x berolinensis]
MSIVPIGNQGGEITNPASLDTWDPEDFFTSLDLWDPFQNFPFPSLFSTHFPAFPRQTQVNWKETSRAHVFRAVFPGFGREDVLVYIDDDDMLQISTEDGKFMSKFKLPDNARRDQIKADMVNGVLAVTIPKQEVASYRPDVRVVEIEGSD